MRFLILFLVILFSESYSSQNNVNLTSTNGKVFSLTLKGKLYNKIPQANITLEGIKEDTLKVEVEFENRKKFPLSLFLLEKGESCKYKVFNFRIDYDNVNMKTSFTGVYDIVALPNPLVPSKPVIDTNLKYRNTRLGHFCELKDGKALYFNNTPKEGSCITAMPEEYLSYTNIIMSRASVQDEKYTVAENVCRNNCITVDQLSKLMSYIDYDIEKLKLVRLAYFNLVDTNNQKNLEKNFRFESSVNELRSFLSHTSDYKSKTNSQCTLASTKNEVEEYVQRLSVFSNDAQRFDDLKKTYSTLCYSKEQVALLLGKFIHDREKLDAAKLLYYNCVEKAKFAELSDVFSYNQSGSELKDFLDKQTK